MHGMLLDSRHADEHCDLRGGGGATRAAPEVCSAARTPSTVSDTEASSIARRPMRFRVLCWCPGAESNHRHGDFQSTRRSGQSRANRAEIAVR